MSVLCTTYSVRSTDKVKKNTLHGGNEVLGVTCEFDTITCQWLFLCSQGSVPLYGTHTPMRFHHCMNPIIFNALMNEWKNC